MLPPRLSETDKSIHQDWEARSPDSIMMFPVLPSNQSEQGRSQDSRFRTPHHKLGWRHSSQQFWRPSKNGGVYNVERRIIENNPPSKRTFPQ